MERSFHESQCQIQLKADVFHFQIITKEVEVSDWKKKFDASRQEVTEMRLAAWGFNPEMMQNETLSFGFVFPALQQFRKLHSFIS